jgi:DNA-binding NarL/FixJ family response regulator
MGTLRVLVADDHEIVRKGLRTILEEQPGISGRRRGLRRPETVDGAHTGPT